MTGQVGLATDLLPCHSNFGYGSKTVSLRWQGWGDFRKLYRPTNTARIARMIDFKGHRFEKGIIPICVRWYLAYPLSYRNLEEMMAERGVEVDRSDIYRRVQKSTPLLEAAFRKGKKRQVGKC